ncbi:MAG: hypothetical protein N3A58_03755 [Spirochaetes bacterium]|nr:hypothetical protein [Spirochaetota bacterium]
MFSYILIFIILLSLIITYLWVSEKLKIAGKIKKYEKKISYAIIAGDENLSKNLILDAIVYYFRKKSFFALIRGFDVRGIKSEFEEFFEFKGKIYGKLNSMLISKGLPAISNEKSSKFEKNFIDKLNYSDKNSFKYQKFNLEIFEDIIKQYKNIIKEELFS